MMSGTSHSTALFHLEATPAACPTIAHASWGPPLLVSTPSRACQPCPPCRGWRSRRTPAAPPILHDDNPESLFSSTPSPPPSSSRPKRAPRNHRPRWQTPRPRRSMRGTPSSSPSRHSQRRSTRTRVSAPLVSFPMCVVAARCRMGEAERMIELVWNELRMAAILVAQKYTISIPHAHAVGPEAMKRGPAEGA
ncbi:hypothetical protein JB92DRAFT_768642 [Gautieria morchelliformis]|nr:hypothetical protein JB92DRAFT_768642 [Gautieria morchelliformis]